MKTQRKVSSDQVADHTHDAMRQASPWLERFGRFGYAAKGVVYGLIGALAVQVAFGVGGQTTDSQGALQRIAQAPFGQVMLVAVGVGLVGYVLWRIIQAIMDTENKGTDAKGIATRGGYFISGLIYAGLALSAFQIAFGSGGGGAGSSSQGRTAQLMAQPFGQWLVGIVGVIVVGVSLYELYRAYSAKFREKLKLQEMSRTEEMWATRLGRLGYAAHGLALGIIGAFLVVAAIQAQPQEARGLGGALSTLAQQPWGSWLLGIVALGLVAYGIFMLVLARYGRMVIT